MKEAEIKGKSENIDKADEYFEQALILNQDLKSEIENKKRSLVQHYFDMAKNDAIEKPNLNRIHRYYEYLKKCEQKWDMNIEEKINKEKAETMRVAGVTLAGKGEMNDVVEAMNQSSELGGKIAAGEWNELCASGIKPENIDKIEFLYDQIKDACEKAVKLEEEHGGYKGNLGILLAVTSGSEKDTEGNHLTGAMEYLKEFQNWSTDENLKRQIGEWIEKMSKYKYPINDKKREQIKDIFYSN